MSLTLASSWTRKSSEDRRTLLNSCEFSYVEYQRDSEVLESECRWAKVARDVAKSPRRNHSLP